MEPYIPPINPGSGASGESEGAEEAKRDERHHDKMLAFKQAIERSRVVNEQAALTGGTVVPQGKAPKAPRTSAPRSTPRPGDLRDVELPEGAELPAEFAELKQETPLPPKSPPQAALDPTYRQALLRMQAEGVALPPALLELLRETESAKPRSVVGDAPELKEPSEAQAEIAAGELADPVGDARRMQAREAAYAGSDSHSGSASADKSKDKSSESADSTGDVPGAIAVPGQAFVPQTQEPGQAQRVPPPAPLVQELVEFATFGRNEAGFLEFRLGLVQDALGGLRIQLASYGNRRVGLKVKGTGGRAADIGDAELAGLVDALRAKNVEVVEVVRE